MGHDCEVLMKRICVKMKPCKVVLRNTKVEITNCEVILIKRSREPLFKSNMKKGRPSMACSTKVVELEKAEEEREGLDRRMKESKVEEERLKEKLEKAELQMEKRFEDSARDWDSQELEKVMVEQREEVMGVRGVTARLAQALEEVGWKVSRLRREVEQIDMLD